MTPLWKRLTVTASWTLGAIAVLWFLFMPFSSWLGGDDLRQLDVKDRLSTLATIRGQIATVLSGAVVGGGLYYTSRKFFLDRDKQFTDRFNSAVDHLGSADRAVRAGGVRALERIMNDSPTDRNRVLETLTGYLRQHIGRGATTAVTEPPADDIAAAVAALRRPRTRGKNPAEEPLNLRGVQLCNANLHKITLRNAYLIDADLRGADLSDAVLVQVRLDGATLFDADLTGADLTGAKLAGARLRAANLGGALLPGADITDADLSGTDLRGTDLSEVLGLTSEQIDKARINDHTRLPTNMELLRKSNENTN